MMIKLIVSDIDGTLVNKFKEIPPLFWEVFKLIQQKDIRFCAASGRQIQSLEQLFAPIQQQIAFASDNGALVKYQDKVLHENSIEKTLLKPILETCESIEGIAVALCGKRKAYVKTENIRLYEEIYLHYPAIEYVTDFNMVDDDILKVTVCDEKGSQQNSYPKLKIYESDFKVVISGDMWLDITAKEVNKGVAVSILQKMWGILPEETLVFGDQMNDIEMMAQAKFSYAMKNAHEEVKKIASFITDYDNNHSGVPRKILELIS